MIRIISLLVMLLAYMQVAFAGVQLEAVYPYSMNKTKIEAVRGQSTLPVYVELIASDIPQQLPAAITVEAPEGFHILPAQGWRLQEEGRRAQINWTLPENFGRSFDLVYVQANEEAVAGSKELKVIAATSQGKVEKKIPFVYKAGVTNEVKPGGKGEKSLTAGSKGGEKTVAEGSDAKKKRGEQAGEAKASTGKKKRADKSKFNWYIQSVTLPVDSHGVKDDRTANGTIYVRDTALEAFRNRMMGDGATNWSAVFAHPACHLLLDMRNPQQDIRVLKFKAELLDKKSGKPVPGLCTSGKVSEDNETGWAESAKSEDMTTAMISLDGKKTQAFLLPIYVDYLTILEGDYNLRITVSGNGQQKITELPVTITKKHNLGLAMVAVALLCLLLVIIFSPKIKNCIYQVGAKGAITIALFAAISFGGITLPTTILGDFLHVFLGPFSGLITGLLSGVLQYLLVMALLVLYPKPGVLALMYLVRFLLSGIMFGHFTPLSITSCCVNIVILELTLLLTGFYKKEQLPRQYILLICAAMGLADAAITFVNLEQMMFFYRLYYADWYLALYMIINGFLYSSIGSWFGYHTGAKLRQVMGE